MAKDFLPADDSSLASFATNFQSTVAVVPDNAEEGYASLGFTTAEVAALNQQKTDFNTSLAAHNVAQNAAREARQTKDIAAKALRDSIRAMAKRAQVHPQITDTMRASLGITIPDRVPSAIAAPETSPILTVNTSERGVHRIGYADSATPTKKAKPRGASGLQLYLKVGGEPPVGISEMEFIGVLSSNPKRLSFEDSQLGQQAYYLARWQTAKGLTSPLSPLVSATIVK